MIQKYYKSTDKNFNLLHGDSMELLPQFDHKFDMVFADPPYFLSNDGLSIQSGKIVSVNKGTWDKSEGFEYINDFNRRWISLVRDKMNTLLHFQNCIYRSKGKANAPAVEAILAELLAE